MVFVFVFCLLLANAQAQVNSGADAAAKALWSKLQALGASDYIAFGQEFPTDFKYSGGLSTNTETSDCKDIVGDHPAVFGSDFHYYLYKQDSEKTAHTQAVLKAHARGAIITFDFHMYDRKGSYGASGDNSQLIAHILNAGDTTGDRQWFFGEMDKVINLINNDLKKIPFVFRPFHEMTGNWFWWGSQNSKENYKAFFKATYDYFKTKGVNNLLWCWSPDKTLDWGYYPGDEYVDVIGIDVYEPGLVSYFSTAQLISVLSEMTTYAAEHGKVAALTETGSRDGNSIESQPTFWTSKITNPIKASSSARKIAWILTWINAPWSKPYIPHSGSSADAKADFKALYDDPMVLFEQDLAGFFKSPPPPLPPGTTPTPTPTPTPGTPPSADECTDVAPDTEFTCVQQAGWGKCSEPWMVGFCNLSCGKCAPAPGVCTDNPPSTDFTCVQQAMWGKCSEPWMVGYCDKSCNRCAQGIPPASPPPGEVPPPPPAPTPTPTAPGTSPTPTPTTPGTAPTPPPGTAPTPPTPTPTPPTPGTTPTPSPDSFLPPNSTDVPVEGETGLDDGAIAGIAIGGVAAVAAVGVAIFFGVKGGIGAAGATTEFV